MQFRSEELQKQDHPNLNTTIKLWRYNALYLLCPSTNNSFEKVICTLLENWNQGVFLNLTTSFKQKADSFISFVLNVQIFRQLYRKYTCLFCFFSE